MSGNLVGADSDALDVLGRQMDAAARTLQSIEHRLSAQLHSAPWRGAEADRFRSDWGRQLRGVLAAAAGDLSSVGNVLRANAEEQRRASAGGSSAGGAANGPTTGRSLEDPSPVQKDRRHALRIFNWTIFEWGGLASHDYGETPLYQGARGAEITPGDVKQGSLGDCYFVAALAAMAATPEGARRIRECIRDNGDGTYTVHFADGKDVTVDSDFWQSGDGRGTQYAKVGSDKWAALLEEAYARRHGGSYEDIEGGYASDVFREFGLDSHRADLDGGSSSTLQEALRTGHTVVLDARLDNPDGIHGYPSPPTPRHAFSVLGTREVNGEMMVEIRNPWGSNSGLTADGIDMGSQQDGVFWVKESDLSRYFYRVEWASA